MFDTNSITGKLRAMDIGPNSIIVLLIIAIFKTSFAEFKYGLDSISKLIYSNVNLTDEKGSVWISIKIDSMGIMEKTEIIKSENEN